MMPVDALNTAQHEQTVIMTPDRKLACYQGTRGGAGLLAAGSMLRLTAMGSVLLTPGVYRRQGLVDNK